MFGCDTGSADEGYLAEFDIGEVKESVFTQIPNILVLPAYRISYWEEDSLLAAGGVEYNVGTFCFPGQAVQDSGSCSECTPQTYSLVQQSTTCRSCAGLLGDGLECGGFSTSPEEICLEDDSELPNGCGKKKDTIRGQTLKVLSDYWYKIFWTCDDCNPERYTEQIVQGIATTKTLYYQNWIIKAFKCPFAFCCSEPTGCDVVARYWEVDTKVLNPTYDQVFKNICPINRDPSVAFCGSCIKVNGELMSESIGAAGTCIEGCKSWNEVNYEIGVIFLCIAFIAVMVMLTSTHESGRKVIQ